MGGSSEIERQDAGPTSDARSIRGSDRTRINILPSARGFLAFHIVGVLLIYQTVQRPSRMLWLPLYVRRASIAHWVAPHFRRFEDPEPGAEGIPMELTLPLPG